jgi:hypothetical protein
MSAVQNWAQLGTLAAILAGTLAYQTHYIDKRIEGLQDMFKVEIAGLRSYIDAKFEAVNVRMKAIQDRLERLEHPVTRP